MRAFSISTSVEFCLRLFGIWPDLSYGFFIWFTYVSSDAVILYFQYVYIFGHYNNMTNVIDALSNTLACSLVFLKLISLRLNRRLLQTILITMKEDWSTFERDQSVRSIMTYYANLSRQCSNIFISINSAAATSFVFTNLMLSAESEENFNVSSKVLPIKIELPFEVNTTPFFAFLVLIVFLFQVSCAALAATTNSLILSLVFHVSGQIDILRRNMLAICNNESPQRSSSVTDIKLLIIRHQRIITFSENIEELFSTIALMQFLVTAVVLCFMGLNLMSILATNGVSALLMRYVVYYIAITSEAFILCYAGKYLSTKSKSIGNAAYESLWYNTTPTESRILMFIILRSQKQLTITAGKIMNLSLEEFTSVMQASVSYMSVVHAMY